ncbi:MAG: Ig-like domain-containing protein [Candidatus Helarchaeota archaeon]
MKGKVLGLIVILLLITSFITPVMGKSSGNSNVKMILKSVPHKVMNRHYTILNSTLYEKGTENPIINVEISFYIKIDQEWVFIGKNNTNNKGVSLFYYYIDLLEGKYRIRAEFEGSALYTPFFVESWLLVQDETLTVDFEEVVVRYSDKATFKVKLINPAGNPIPNRNISLYAKWERLWVSIFENKKTNHEGIAETSGYVFLPPNSYDVKVVFNGGHYYGVGEVIFYDGILVEKEISIIQTLIDFVVVYSDESYISIYITDDEGDPIVSEKVIFSIYHDNEWEVISSIFSNDYGFAAVHYLPLLPAGTYPLKVTIQESDYYLSDEKEGTLTILKESSTIEIFPIETEFAETIYFPAELKDDEGIPIVNREILFYINDNGDWTFTTSGITDNFGLVSASWFADVNPNTYNIKAVFEGDEYYSGQTEILSSGLIIKRRATVLSDPSVDRIVNQKVTITTRLTDSQGNPIANEPIAFYIILSETLIGINYTNQDGYASITYLPTISPRTYTITVVYEGSALNAPVAKSGTLTIAQATALTVDGRLYEYWSDTWGFLWLWIDTNTWYERHKYVLSWNDSVAFRGTVTSNGTPQSGVNVTFYYGDNGTDTWTLIGYATTDSTGIAVVNKQWTAAEINCGIYDMKVNTSTGVTEIKEDYFIAIKGNSYAPNWWSDLEFDQYWGPIYNRF